MKTSIKKTLFAATIIGVAAMSPVHASIIRMFEGETTVTPAGGVADTAVLASATFAGSGAANMNGGGFSTFYASQSANTASLSMSTVIGDKAQSSSGGALTQVIKNDLYQASSVKVNVTIGYNFGASVYGQIAASESMQANGAIKLKSGANELLSKDYFAFAGPGLQTAGVLDSAWTPSPGNTSILWNSVNDPATLSTYQFDLGTLLFGQTVDFIAALTASSSTSVSGNGQMYAQCEISTNCKTGGYRASIMSYVSVWTNVILVNVPVPAGNVPEPASLALLMAALLGGMRVRKLQR